MEEKYYVSLRHDLPAGALQHPEALMQDLTIASAACSKNFLRS